MDRGYWRKIQIIVLVVSLSFCLWPKVAFTQGLEDAGELNRQVIKLYKLGKYQEAIPCAKRALEIVRKALGPDHPDVATCLNCLAVLYDNLGDYGQAELLYKHSLEIREKAVGPDHPDVATDLNNLAELYRKLGDYEQAEPLYKRALEIREKALDPDHPDVAISLNCLAALYHNLGDYGQAESLYKRSLEIMKKALGPDHPDVATCLNNMAELYRDLGDYGQAEPLLKRSLKISEKALGPDHPNVAAYLDNMASLYYYLGDYVQAEPLYKRALEIREKALGPDHPDVATSLGNLAALYDNLGDYGQAEPLYKRSFEISEKALGPNHPDVATCLDNLAEHYRDLGDYGQAEPLYRRSLEIREKVLGPDHPDVAISLNNLALLYKTLGDYGQAEPLLKRSLEISEKALGTDHPYVTAFLNNLGFLYLEDGRLDEAYKIFKKQDAANGLGRYYLAMGKYQEAEKEFSRLLKRSEDARIKDFIFAAFTGLGLSYEGQGDFARAREYFQKGITIIEEQWITLAPSAKKCFLSGKVGAGFPRLSPYEGLLRLISKEKKKGYEEEAFRLAEGVKGRIFLEMLATRQLYGKTKIDDDILQKDQEYQRGFPVLRERIEKLEEYLKRVSSEQRKELQEKLKGLKAEFQQKEQEYVKFIEEVKLKNTELASLITISPMPLEKIQASLDQDTTLIEYYTAKDRTYAWLVTQKGIQEFSLAAGEDMLKEKTNGLLVANLANVPAERRNADPKIILMPKTDFTQKATAINPRESKKRFLENAQHIYQEIFAPLEKEIKSEKLIIVPHGVLHKVPFAALGDGKKYLVDTYRISYLPSAGSISYLKRKKESSPKRLLAFANPVTDYLPLGFAEEEAKTISRLFGEQQKELYQRDQATETCFKQKAQGFEVIHLATHGEFNELQPLLSGLLFSKPGQADTSNDGRLQVHEVFGLNLPLAHLVTLSACQTGLCKIQGGDDLVGLSRSFIYAGTPSLLATLWDVEDKSTSILMEKFYQKWLKEGMSKSKALQIAQVELKKTYDNPYYWAPFIMIGE